MLATTIRSPSSLPVICTRRLALGLAIGGVAGSYVAAKFFESLNIRTVRWLVIVVVLYTAITMLMSASAERVAGESED